MQRTDLARITEHVHYCNYNLVIITLYNSSVLLLQVRTHGESQHPESLVPQN